jgi:hypothetical protein
MTAAIFGLVGVLVGGLLATTGQYLLGVRNEYAAATVAARLIGAELNMLCALVRSGAGNQDPSALDTPVWGSQQAAFALVVPNGHWDAVESAYVLLAALRASPAHEPFPSETSSRFLDAVHDASTLLEEATAEGGPLHRRGSPLERRRRLWGEP